MIENKKFWKYILKEIKNYKFTSKSWFRGKKWKNYKLKKLLKILKLSIKKDERIIKSDDTEIEKYKFHQYKCHFW